jgi:hypothetical protein
MKFRIFVRNKNKNPMKTQIINFVQDTPCFYNTGFGSMRPHTLFALDYEVSNLVIHKRNYLTFDLYDDEGFIGHYIVFNVSLTENESGELNATTNLPEHWNFEWNYFRGDLLK